MDDLRYIVTYIPAGRSEPQEAYETVETGNPDNDADALIDSYDQRGEEVIYIRWSNGSGTTYAAPGINR